MDVISAVFGVSDTAVDAAAVLSAPAVVLSAAVFFELSVSLLAAFAFPTFKRILAVAGN